MTNVKIKRRPRFTEFTVRDLLDGSEVPMLRDEIAEWRDNIEEKFSNTAKFEEVSECADALDNIADEFESHVERLIELLEATDAGKAVLDRKVTVPTPKTRQSRADRLGEITGSIEAALRAIEEAGLRNEEIGSLGDDIEDQIGELDDVNFPGMY